MTNFGGSNNYVPKRVFEEYEDKRRFGKGEDTKGHFRRECKYGLNCHSFKKGECTFLHDTQLPDGHKTLANYGQATKFHNSKIPQPKHF